MHPLTTAALVLNLAMLAIELVLLRRGGHKKRDRQLIFFAGLLSGLTSLLLIISLLDN